MCVFFNHLNGAEFMIEQYDHTFPRVHWIEKEFFLLLKLKSNTSKKNNEEEKNINGVIQFIAFIPRDIIIFVKATW